jgi:N-acetyl-anhydromuramyl-L-alanine amidase AmpD
LFWNIPAWAAAVSAVAVLAAPGVRAVEGAEGAAKPVPRHAVDAQHPAKAAPRRAANALGATRADGKRQERKPQHGKVSRGPGRAKEHVARNAPVKWVPAARRAYGAPGRPDAAIKRIIIHVAQAPAGSVVNTFKNGASGSSAHYVVSASGRVTQMVPDHAIAWHAGNRLYNATSIGIEHAGYVQRAESFTEPMYRASGRLAGHLAEKYHIPLDRLHVIGHNEVPDPHEPGKFGGFDGHTDPGPHWNWQRYMEYARESQRQPERTSAKPGNPPGKAKKYGAARSDAPLEPRRGGPK